MSWFAKRTLSMFLLLGAWTSLACAQGYPDRAVKIIVPTAPGGAIDTTARVIADKMQAKWSKPVIVENRPGAAMRTRS